MAARLSRRHFAPLTSAPKRQGRIGEFRRLFLRASGHGGEHLAYEANDWLMRVMAREVEHTKARAVHAYEDCSLWQFEKAKKKGIACVYDMPIGYYPAWQCIETELLRKYRDWLPGVEISGQYARPEQKLKEMALADLVLVPSAFVEGTIREFLPDKQIVRAPYGVASDFWSPGPRSEESRPFTFICAGQNSIRKGTPDLLEAWKRADLKDARLRLVGPWRLAEQQLKDLPPDVEWVPPCSREDLRQHYRSADVFVLASYFEGQALALLEAMAYGLAPISSHASGIEGLPARQSFRAGDIDALIAALQWANSNRDHMEEVGRQARDWAQKSSWEAYRHKVRDAVTPLL